MSQEKLPNIYQRINAVRKAKDYLQKAKVVDNKYKVITSDQVLDLIRDALVTHGIVTEMHLVSETVVQDTLMKTLKAPIIRAEGVYEVHFVNIDEPTDRAISRVSAHALDTGDKAPGKLATYAWKTAVVKMFSLVSGEDEERRQEGDATQGMPEGEIADWNAAIDATTLQAAEDLWKKIVAACRKYEDQPVFLQLKARMSARVNALKKESKKPVAAKEVADAAASH